MGVIRGSGDHSKVTTHESIVGGSTLFHRTLRPFLFSTLLIPTLWISVSPIFAQTENETPASNPALMEALRPYADRIEASLRVSLDPRFGQGTGKFMNDLNSISREMQRNPLFGEGVDLSTELQKLFQDENGNKKIEEYDIPQSFADYLNDRLKIAKADWFTVRPTKRARLLELFYQLGSVGYEKVDLAEMVKLSRELYPQGLEGESPIPELTEVIIPYHLEERVEAARKKLESHPQRSQFPNLSLVRNPFITSEDQVALPDLEAPLSHETRMNKWVKAVRTAVAMPLAAIGNLMGGNFSPASLASAGSTIGQETNFIYTSSRWNRFWQRFKLQGNFAINANFGALVTSFAILTAMTTSAIENPVLKMAAGVGLAAVSFVGSYVALEFIKYRSLKVLAGLIGGMAALAFFKGHYINLNLAEFFIKALGINTAAFFATFGATQVLAGSLHNNGELSEGRRYPLESLLNIFAGTARALALGSLAMGMGGTLFNVDQVTGPIDLLGINWADIEFNKTEVYSWVAQFAVGALVTLPLAVRQLRGNYYIDLQTAQNLSPLTVDPANPKPGVIGRACSELIRGPIRWLSRLYTPRRTAAAPAR